MLFHAGCKITIFFRHRRSFMCLTTDYPSFLKFLNIIEPVSLSAFMGIEENRHILDAANFATIYFVYNSI